MTDASAIREDSIGTGVESGEVRPGTTGANAVLLEEEEGD